MVRLARFLLPQPTRQTPLRPDLGRTQAEVAVIAMSIHYNIEWFTEQTYRIIRRFILPHPDIPDTYEEWLYFAEKRITKLKTKGDTVEKVEVNPNEFARHCEMKGCKYDIVALHNFVTWQGGRQEH